MPNNPKHTPPLLTAREASALLMSEGLLGWSVRSVRLKAKELEGVKSGKRTWLFHEDKIRAYIQKTVQPQQKVDSAIQAFK